MARSAEENLLILLTNLYRANVRRSFGSLFRMLLQPFPRGGEFSLELFHGEEGELGFSGHDFFLERVEG